MAPPTFLSGQFGEYFTGWNMTVNASADYALTCSMDDQNTDGISAATLGGQAMTKLTALFNAGDYRSVTYFGKSTPLTGSQELLLTGMNAYANTYLLSLSGVNAADPFGDFDRVLTTGVGETSMSLTLDDVTANDLALFFCFVPNARGALTITSGTAIYEPSGDNTFKVIQGSGTGSVTGSFTFPNADFTGGAVLTGIVIQAASGVDLTNKCRIISALS